MDQKGSIECTLFFTAGRSWITENNPKVHDPMNNQNYRITHKTPSGETPKNPILVLTASHLHKKVTFSSFN